MTDGPHAALVAFARELRAAGVALGSGQVARYCEAVVTLGPRDLDDLYWAGRATLVADATDFATYDEVFASVFTAEPSRSATAPRALPDGVELRGSVVDDALEEADGGDMPGTVASRASDAEVLRHKRFADLDEQEQAAVRRLIAALRLDPPAGPSRRARPSPRGSRADLRRNLRRALRTDGEIVDWSRRRRLEKPCRLVLLLDVSGSMSEYSRALVGFAHAIARGGADVEVFCFGTRVTRVTDALRTHQPDAALLAAAEGVTDWDGGTRIGSSLSEFLRRWGRPRVARGAVVVICSDGLERADPEALGRQMGRLSRLAHRIVWVNPLKGDPRYEPLARGMAAALPWIDVFVAGHNLASLDSLTDVLRDLV